MSKREEDKHKDKYKEDKYKERGWYVQVQDKNKEMSEEEVAVEWFEKVKIGDQQDIDIQRNVEIQCYEH